MEMKHVCLAILIAGAASRVLSADCNPACTEPAECKSTDPRGTCCCPFPLEAYPPVGNPPYLTLQAYHLSTEQEAMFNDTDQAPSAFWYAWDENTSMDVVELNCTYSGNAWNRSDEGFFGEADANMVVRAAWSAEGLYLYLKVRDDQFVDDAIVCIKEYCPGDASELSWANDAMDIYFDPFSTDIHDAAPETVFPRPNFNRLTKKTVQLQYQFGAAGVKDRFSYNRVNQSNGEMEIDRDVTFADAKANYNGLTGEVFRLTDDTKAQEWFIPWSHVGNGGIPSPNPGTRFAFSCGYNDADGGATDMDCLRWRNAGDPTKRTMDLATGSTEHVPVEAWGDIEVSGDPIAEVGVVHAPVRHSAGTGPVRAEYTDLHGRRIAGVDLSGTPGTVELAVSSSLVVERLLRADGSVYAASFLTPRNGRIVREF